MDRVARLAATAAAVFACGAIAAPDPRHLIDDSGANPPNIVKPLYVCDSFICAYTTIDAKTEDWTDKTGSLHKDGCTARWAYRGFDVSGRIGSKLRWKINPLDGESYNFDPVIGVKLDDDDKNERRLDLDQEGRDFGTATFTWYDFNRRTRLGDYPGEPDPLKRGIRFDYRVYRVRGANGAAGPELCGSFDPVIYNRG
jgi:hypothetical protein